ncbi:MAG: hypothetical protein ACHBN1_24405 [Heteroscytonema crispum UTEX LB 1556]
MFQKSHFFLLICLIWLSGCLKFGNNYYNKQPPSVEEVGKWLGAPVPSSYSDLHYQIIDDAPDPQASIAVKVPEEYFQMLIKNKNLVKYDDFKHQLASDLKPREWQDSNIPDDFIQKPFKNTTIWVTLYLAPGKLDVNSMTKC